MTDDPVYLFAKWKIKEGNLETVLNLLPELAKKSREEDGNLFFKIHQSISEKNTLMLYEGYRSEAAVAEHRNARHFQELVLGKIAPMLDSREGILTTVLDLI